MIAIRSEQEIAILREADQVVADVLATLAALVEPGITTDELDAVADRMIREAGGTPSFLGYQGFPKSTCISVDEVIVHGIPGTRKLQAGQIVSMDVGVYHGGFHGDAAVTVPCGAIDAERQRLMDVTDLALSRAIGETAPLIIVGAATFLAFTPDGVLSPFTVLPIQIFNWISRPQAEFQEIAAAGIIVLLVILLSMNAVAVVLRNYFERKRRW